MDDTDLLSASLNEEAAKLSKVCYVFSEGMSWVLRRWVQRREQLRSEHQRIGGFIRDLLSSSGIIPGKLAPLPGSKVSPNYDGKKLEDGATEGESDTRVLESRPFKALTEWRTGHLQNAEEEAKLLREGKFRKLRELRRGVSKLKKSRRRMNSDRMTFLRYDDEWHDDSNDGPGIEEASQLQDGVQYGTVVSNGQKWKRLRKSETSKVKKRRSEKNRQRAGKIERQQLKNDGPISEAGTLGSVEAASPSEVSPKRINRKAIRRATWTKRLAQWELDAMEREWAIQNPEAAERRKAKLRLRAAYGDYKVWSEHEAGGEDQGGQEERVERQGEDRESDGD